jgi:hypothetical protein
MRSGLPETVSGAIMKGMRKPRLKNPCYLRELPFKSVLSYQDSIDSHLYAPPEG